MRKQLAAAVLLPLPFAAVPLVAVLIGMRSGDDPEVVLRDAPSAAPAMARYDTPSPANAVDMTYRAPGGAGCSDGPGDAT